MSSQNIESILPILMSELVNGSPDPSARTYMLNRGDAGLLAALDGLSADAASATNAGGASIAAHADHLRYGLSLLNKWASGVELRWQEIDWTASWKKSAVSDDEWQAVRNELRREAMAWIERLRTPPDVSEVEAGWMVGSIAHLAYHLGAIRQINGATRGPTAEDEARAEAELRAKRSMNERPV
jgi:hypothetical protein